MEKSLFCIKLGHATIIAISLLIIGVCYVFTPKYFYLDREHLQATERYLEFLKTPKTGEIPKLMVKINSTHIDYRYDAKSDEERSKVLNKLVDEYIAVNRLIEAWREKQVVLHNETERTAWALSTFVLYDEDEIKRRHEPIEKALLDVWTRRPGYFMIMTDLTEKEASLNMNMEKLKVTFAEAFNLYVDQHSREEVLDLFKSILKIR